MDFSVLFAKWRSDYVTRDELFELTGGMLKPKTLRTYDSEGKGIKGKENIGYKQVIYPVKEVIAYLERRAAKHPKQPAKKSEVTNV